MVAKRPSDSLGKPVLTLAEAEARRERIIARLAEGWSLRQVAAAEGISAPRVAYIRDHPLVRDPVSGEWLRPPRASKGEDE